MTEADESATNKQVALSNLWYQIRNSETVGVVNMYELAAWNVGATVEETERIISTPCTCDYHGLSCLRHLGVGKPINGT